MTITQVKEINEKIIELTDYIRRYRLETVAVTEVKNTPVDIMIRIGNVDHQLGYASESFIEGWYFANKRGNLKYANGALNDAATAVFKASLYRYKVGDDISLDELSLWIDLFAVVYGLIC